MNRGNNSRGFKRPLDSSFMWNNMGGGYNTSGNNNIVGGYNNSGNNRSFGMNSGNFNQPTWCDNPQPYNNETSIQKPRVVNCNELRERDEGATVEINGRVGPQQLGRFVILKDAHGSIQLVAQEENIIRRLANIPLNSNITIVGKVKRRPQRQIHEVI